MIKNPDKSVSFDDSVVEFTSRVFGCPRKEFMDHHKELIGLVRNSMSQNLLEIAINRYSNHLKNEFSNWKSQGKGELFNDIYNVVYWSNFKILLGEIFLNEKFKDSKQFFSKMDNNFEIAASGLIPEFIFSIRDARDYFYKMFDFGIKSMEIEEKSILTSIIQRIGSDEGYTRNFCIAILWASEANSLPGTYWAVVNLLKHPDTLKDVIKELDDVIGKEDITYEHLSKLNFTKSVVLEMFRLHTPGMMIRKVMKPLELNEYIIPEGYNLAINPLALHIDQHGPNSREFYPSRWKESSKFDYYSFGKGGNGCPGKAFAIHSTMIFLAHFFRNFELKFEENKFCEPDMSRLIGIPHPSNKTEKFSFKKK